MLKAPAVETPHVVNPDLAEQLGLEVDPMVTFCRAAIDQHQHRAGCTRATKGVSRPAPPLFMGQPIRNVDQRPIGLAFVQDHLPRVEVQRRFHGTNHDHGFSTALLRQHQ